MRRAWRAHAALVAAALVGALIPNRCGPAARVGRVGADARRVAAAAVDAQVAKAAVAEPKQARDARSAPSRGSASTRDDDAQPAHDLLAPASTPSARALWRSVRAGAAAPRDLTVAARHGSECGTVKLLCRLGDGLEVETVAIPPPPERRAGSPPERRAANARAATTLCLSSQVGCARGCTFCATGRMGIVRNLTASEILDQAVAGIAECAARGLPPPRNVVFMGRGRRRFLASRRRRDRGPSARRRRAADRPRGDAAPRIVRKATPRRGSSARRRRREATPRLRRGSTARRRRNTDHPRGDAAARRRRGRDANFPRRFVGHRHGRTARQRGRRPRRVRLANGW